MVRKLPAYINEILLGKGVKWNRQTNRVNLYITVIKIWILYHYFFLHLCFCYHKKSSYLLKMFSTSLYSITVQGSEPLQFNKATNLAQFQSCTINNETSTVNSSTNEIQGKLLNLGSHLFICENTLQFIYFYLFKLISTISIIYFIWFCN
jgi:hypothetical protein